ncbi:MAG TPA: M3 family metallopeptidase [Bacteroidales bacterium]|nr:M3 family metallopeptidase [Bacteroidales bacterium]HRX97399.1 M3 family metallopeptidase [Bacteroidales bacterium]
MRVSMILLVVLLLNLSACTYQDNMKNNNPFFVEYGTPFEVPPFDLIQNKDYLPAFEAGINQQSDEVALIINRDEEPTFENVIVALDQSGELLDKVSSVFFNLSSANTNDSIKAIAKEVAPLLAQHRDNIALNEDLFKKVKAVYERRDELELNPEQAMLLKETYEGFVRGGANLQGEAKERYREINKELSVLTVEFGENLLNETNAYQLVIKHKSDLSGLPDFVVDMGAADAKAAGMDEAWMFTLQKPSLIPFLQYADNRNLRKQIFKAYINRGDNNNDSDNKEIAAKIASLRAERANLLGFNSHAAFVLDNNMAKTPDKVYALMDRVWDAALPVAKAEAAELQKMIDAENGGFKLEAWDWWYYAEKLRKEKYDLDDEQLKPYFELENVKNGMFGVANKLYGLSFKVRDDFPKPHPDAVTYEVFDNDGTHQAVLIMDFFPRESKRAGAWMSSYRKQQKRDGENISPIITMVMNFTKPTAESPSLLTFEEVSTMFHEFGHALHGMLSDCTYEMLSGTAVSRDFVELPSQIMENWAAEPEVLKSYALHYKTGEPIPDELIDKMNASKHFNQGFATVEFTAAAYLDMAWHTLETTDLQDANVFEKDAMDNIGLIPEIVVRYRSPYFAHIFSGGYSSGYYSYQWAEVLDADAFDAFKEHGLFDPETALAFRKNILEKGGTEDPMKLYMQFRGQEPDASAMLRRKGLL